MSADPYRLVVDEYLEDFRGGVALLRTKPSDEEHNQAAEKLCKLSRDMTLSLGRPTDYEPEYIRAIADLFDEAVRLIRKTNADVTAFRDHIQHRAQKLRDELSMAHI